MKAKRCTACMRLKATASYYRCAASRDGRDPWCKDCRRAYLRKWIARHRSAHARWLEDYKERHREQLRLYQREYQRRRRALMRAGKWKTKAA